MKVILKKDVQNLGHTGDIKDVSDGYARNFLIPSGAVEIATKEIVKQAENLKTRKQEESKEGLKAAEELSRKVEGLAIEIKSKTDDSGKLYAAIKTEDISTAIIKKGFEIDAGKVVIKNPIKEVGEYKVVINLEHGLEAVVNLTVKNDK